jgi:DNA-binding YbaB/EbfC family protein
MGKRGGFPGGGFSGGGGGMNINKLMKEAQKMQEEMARGQEELGSQDFTAASGGGAVKIVMSGTKELKEVKIAPDVVDPDDVEMLQDLIVAAFNEVNRKIDEQTNEKMGKLTGGMKLPGMF